LLAELEPLLNRFFFYLDHSDYAALIAMTHEDFRWHRQGRVLDGHAAVIAALHERPVTQRSAHVITNTFVESWRDGEAVTGSYMTAYRFDNGERQTGPVTISGPLRLSRVTTRFVRDADHWRIAEQRLASEFEFTAP
jgi:hypothetical protein